MYMHAIMILLFATIAFRNDCQFSSLFALGDWINVWLTFSIFSNIAQCNPGVLNGWLDKEVRLGRSNPDHF